MPSYHYKLVVDAVEFSEFNHEEQCGYMAEKCNNDANGCTIGYLTCPFIGKRCSKITAEDWMEVLVPSTEAENA